jgi:hypothetical protein
MSPVCRAAVEEPSKTPTETAGELERAQRAPVLHRRRSGGRGAGILVA